MEPKAKSRKKWERYEDQYLPTSMKKTARHGALKRKSESQTKSCCVRNNHASTCIVLFSVANSIQFNYFCLALNHHYSLKVLNTPNIYLTNQVF